jgi:putative acetyltransferase
MLMEASMSLSSSGPIPSPFPVEPIQAAQAAPIAVRHAEPRDVEALHAIFSGPKVVSGTLQLPFPSPEPWRKRLADPADGSYTLVACAGAEVVGWIAVMTVKNPRRRHVGQIAMAVRDDWQGRGVGTILMGAAIELAEGWLNLERIELDVYTDNEPGIRLYRRFGFEVEGMLRRYAFRNGQYADVYAMARLRPSGTPAEA